MTPDQAPATPTAMPPASEGAPTYKVTLRTQPDASDPGAIRRLRAALKTLWRRFGWKCTGVERIKPDER